MRTDRKDGGVPASVGKGRAESGTHAGSEIGVVPRHGDTHARSRTSSRSGSQVLKRLFARQRVARRTWHHTRLDGGVLTTLGWRGFDPTVGESISLDHIVVGVSSHPRGVMPVSGAFSGTRVDCTAMHVAVKTEELPPSLANDAVDPLGSG